MEHGAGAHAPALPCSRRGAPMQTHMHLLSLLQPGRERQRGAAGPRTVREAGPQVAQVVVRVARRAGAPRQRQQRRAQAR
jgi:hypothetical protein